MIFHTQPHPNGKDIIVSSPKPENWRISTKEEQTLAAIGARFNRKESGRCKVVYTASRAQWRDLCRLVDAGWQGDRWALANPKDVESRTFWHPDYGEESFSRADALALCPPVSQRCKRTAEIFAPQTPQDVQEAVCATHAAPKPEIASTGSERAELTPADALPGIDAIMARLDAVESAVAELPRIRMKAIAVRLDDAEADTPCSVENGTDPQDPIHPNVIAWPGARAMHQTRNGLYQGDQRKSPIWMAASNGALGRRWGIARFGGAEWLEGAGGRYITFASRERAQERADSLNNTLSDDAEPRERAKRERLVRRYLAMRKERGQWRGLAENGADERQTLRKSRDDFESLSIRTANVAACQGEKRRRAVTLARDLQKRLNAEHRLVEHYSEKHRKACEHNRRLNNELSALKAKLECPSTPDRVSDVAMLRAENSAMRYELAMVKADRDRLAAVADNHAGAISALVDHIARAEAAMRRAGINAGPVAVAA